jgi:hypothetical protein
MTTPMYYYTNPITGPKGKIVTGYAVVSGSNEIARYRIRTDGHGYWRTALNLARNHAERLNAELDQGGAS